MSNIVLNFENDGLKEPFVNDRVLESLASDGLGSLVIYYVSGEVIFGKYHFRLSGNLFSDHDNFIKLGELVSLYEKFGCTDTFKQKADSLLNLN